MTITRTELDELICEFKRDLQAYEASMDALQRRKLEVEDENHALQFNESSGCVAVVHVLIMNITRTEGIIEDLNKHKDELPEERPQLKLVQDEVNHARNNRR